MNEPSEHQPIARHPRWSAGSGGARATRGLARDADAVLGFVWLALLVVALTRGLSPLLAAASTVI
jgi:hypothetical protein